MFSFFKLDDEVKKYYDSKPSAQANLRELLLHWAAYSGWVYITEMLIASGLNVNAVDGHGNTPLHYATQYGHKDIVLALLKAGANPNIKNKFDNPPLNKSVLNGNVDITKSLLEYKANPNQYDPTSMRLYPHASVFSIDKNYIQIAKLLAEAGASHIPTSQTFLVEPIKSIGLKNYKHGGICFGLASLATQQFLISPKKFNDFFNIIESIARIPKDEFKATMELLKNKRLEMLSRAKQNAHDELLKEYGYPLDLKALKRIRSKKINDKFKELQDEMKASESAFWEIPAFLEAIDLYFISRNHLDLFPKNSFVDNQNLLQSLPILAPNTLNPEHVISIDSISGIYTKSELEEYFKCLHAALDKTSARMALMIRNCNHAMALFIDPTMSPLWGLLDPNYLPLQLIAKDKLAEAVYRGFQGPYSDNPVTLHLTPYVLPKEHKQISTCIQEWKTSPSISAMHKLTKTRVEMEDEFKSTWLHEAVKHNDKVLVKKLLEAKSDPEHIAINRPLHLAAQNGYIDIIKLLRSYGASFDAPNGDIGDTCLHIAAQEGQLDTVKYLLQERMDVNHPAKNGFTPLHAATRNNRWEVLQFLLDEKANVDSLQGMQSPIIQAALEGSIDCVKGLILAKANLDICDDGASAIFAAAQNGHTEIVQVLADAKANLIFKYNDKTALQVAIEKGHKEIISMLFHREHVENQFYMLYQAIRYYKTSRIIQLIESGVSAMLSLKIPVKALQEKIYSWDRERLGDFLKDKIIHSDHTVDITPMDIAIIAKEEKVIDYLKQCQPSMDRTEPTTKRICIRT